MAIVSTGGVRWTVWRDAAVSVALTVSLGVGIGLVTGLALVNVLGLLGMDVQTGTGELLHRMFGG